MRDKEWVEVSDLSVGDRGGRSLRACEWPGWPISNLVGNDLKFPL